MFHLTFHVLLKLIIIYIYIYIFIHKILSTFQNTWYPTFFKVAEHIYYALSLMKNNILSLQSMPTPSIFL